MRATPLVFALALPILLAAPRARAVERGYAPRYHGADIAGPWLAEGLVGTGLGPGYGLGYGGRIGYGRPDGVLLGGEVTRSDIPGGAQTLLGGDLGYRAFPTASLELRPFAMVGAALNNALGGTSQLAVQPGLTAAYHFGTAYVAAEGRILATPSPAAGSVLAGAGLTF